MTLVSPVMPFAVVWFAVETIIEKRDNRRREATKRKWEEEEAQYEAEMRAQKERETANA